MMTTDHLVYIGIDRGKEKIKFTLKQAKKAQRWRRGIALLFIQHRR
jgi:hypothetical protein